MHRRDFIGAAAAANLSGPGVAGGAPPDYAAVRADFPRAKDAAYLDNASCHPLNVHAAAALHRYIDWTMHSVGDPWWPSWARPRDEAKALFAKLINAKPTEVAFARSTGEAENNLLNGMDIQASGGNVVTNDLHFVASVYNYKMRQRAGWDVRIVKHRDWQIDFRDVERAVDRKTKLIAIALVSNVTGYLHDVKALSKLAHAHNAYLFADIIQCAGAVPIDVREMGIDFAACSTYKWLMGVKGFAFLYVREDLQGSVFKTSQHSGRVQYNYHPWTATPDPALDEIAYQPLTGPAQYELSVSYPSYEGVVSALESLKLIHRLGVGNIRAHVKPLTDRLQKELPAMGYPSITPKDNESPITAFVARDPEGTVKKLRQAGVHAAMRFGNKLRISPSVYNNQEDIDRLLNALA